MPEKKCKVTFLPSKKTCSVKRGSDLLSTAVEAGEYINSSCGGDGVCGRCKLLIKKGDYTAEATELVSAPDRKKGYVLACLTTVEGDLICSIPKESRLDLGKVEVKKPLTGMFSRPEEISGAKPVIDETIFPDEPLTSKLYVELPEPTIDDTVSDLDRLERGILEKKDITIMQTGLVNIRKLGILLRESSWKATVTLGKRNETTEIVIVEPGDTSKKNFGVAFDIGTTTIAGQLINLNTKEILSTKAAHNKQAVFGDDVIARIIYASEKSGLEKLHETVIDNMNEMIHEMAEEHGVRMNDITSLMCAGNTTMTHLMLRVDPKFIRREPYVPTANFVPVIRAAEVGIKIHPRGLLSCVPGVSTYVGGDISAGVLASGLSREKPMTLLIDIGTNGEMVLGNQEWMVCSSASAGPAFEGSGVSCGMKASNGAIEKVNIGPGFDVSVQTIGGAKPRGICGSGYIDALRELFKAGIMDRDGKLSSSSGSKRLRRAGNENEFILVFKKKSGTKADIVIKESDIDNLKRSKAAIYSAAAVLTKKMGLGFGDIERLYIAGGFGTSINIGKAVEIGLLPDLAREKFKFIGNSSLLGAREALLSQGAADRARDIARKMTYIELSKDPGYMDEYVSALFFPHTDLEKFPSVRKKR